jgi:DNA helicase II / ATP-dependent DNA helicase PcrA
MFDRSARWDEGLDDQQLEAATHGDGPLVVTAGAGTGKTRVLTARVAALLDRGVIPQQILLLTFTRRAAEEMVSRAASLVGLRGHERPHGGTFHAVGHRHVAANAEVLGLPRSFGVLDPAGACDLMEMIRDDHELTGPSTRFPRSATLVEIYSRCINNDRVLSDLVASEYPWCEPHVEAITDLFKDFTRRKRQSALIDFDDILLSWRALLGDTHLGAQIAERFHFVLVDEYQDVNALQVDIVRRLAPEGRGLTVVGDQAQAIYGFRGSDSRHLRALASSYPDSTIVCLERNFRSQPSVLKVANAIRPREEDRICLTSDRAPGPRPTLTQCYDASAEARTVVANILDAHDMGSQLRDQAILVRAGHHSDLIEIELSVRKVPFRKYGGLRFLEAAHVKDFVAAARLIDNPSDDLAWYRVLRLHRNIGPSRARALLDVDSKANSDRLAVWPEIVAAAPPQARTDLSATLSGLLQARAAVPSGKRAEAVVRAIRPVLSARYHDARARLVDLERLVTAANVVDDLPSWLAELTLDPPVSTGDLAGDPRLDEDYVVISTIHSAKGLEWPIVHLPHLVDGAMPSDMALKTSEGLKEEHRLLYVAVTRARDELRLYAPLRMPHHRRARDDRHSFAPLSRFLEGEVQATLDLIEEPREHPKVRGSDRPARVVVDIDHLWA